MEDKPKFRELYRIYSGLIRNLGFTPEVWLVQKLTSASSTLKRDAHCAPKGHGAQQPHRDRGHIQFAQVSQTLQHNGTPSRGAFSVQAL